MTKEEKLQLAKQLVADRGGRISTVSEMNATREDFNMVSPGLMRLFKGPITAGTRIGLGGASGTGKTSTAKRIVETLRATFPDRLVIVGDFELAEEGNVDRADVNKWDPHDEMVQVLQWPGSGEGFFDTIYELVEKRVPISGVVFDSLNSMSPRVQREGQLDGSSQMASSASMLSNVLRKSTGLLGFCHVTQIWTLQKRQNPAKMGAQSNRIGNAVDHYADIMFDYTGGIMARTSHLTDQDKNLIGAVSQVTSTKKRKGSTLLMPHITTDLYITFDGGVDDAMNLAAGAEDIFSQKGKSILYLPASKDLFDILETKFSPGPSSFTYENETIAIRGTRNSNKEARILLMTEMVKTIPEFHAYLYNALSESLPKPRQEIYPGEYEYPSQEELNALLRELNDATSSI